MTRIFGNWDSAKWSITQFTAAKNAQNLNGRRRRGHVASERRIVSLFHGNGMLLDRDAID